MARREREKRHSETRVSRAESVIPRASERAQGGITRGGLSCAFARLRLSSAAFDTLGRRCRRNRRSRRRRTSLLTRDERPRRLGSGRQTRPRHRVGKYRFLSARRESRTAALYDETTAIIRTALYYYIIIRYRRLSSTSRRFYALPGDYSVIWKHFRETVRARYKVFLRPNNTVVFLKSPRSVFLCS